MSSSRAYPSFAICNGFDGTLSFGDGDTDGAVYREKAVEERCVASIAQPFWGEGVFAF